MHLKKNLHVIDLGCDRQQRQIFTHLSFQLTAGQALFIHGANGSGKSSLLRLLSGLATPSHGKILWQNQPIQENPAAYFGELHYISHTNGIKLGLSVVENLHLASHLTLSFSTQRMDFFLECLQLTTHKNTLAYHLSAGQKRRLALLRLFLFPKRLWILDEPLTALDENTQAFFLSQLETHLTTGGISVISSHHAIALPSLADTEMLRLHLC